GLHALLLQHLGFHRHVLRSPSRTILPGGSSFLQMTDRTKRPLACFMRCSLTEQSRPGAGLSLIAALPQGACHGFADSDHPDYSPHWGATGLALRPGMGLWTQWDCRPVACNSDHSVAAQRHPHQLLSYM